MLKRYHLASEYIVRIGSDVELNRKTMEANFGNQKLTLPLKEFEILYKLAIHISHVVTKESLIEEIWGLEYEGDEHTVHVHINRLRKRLIGLTESFRIITIKGLGYRLEVVS